MEIPAMKKDTPCLLARAIEIAASAHAGQVDKGGAPYVLHPLRMMLHMRSDRTARRMPSSAASSP
jgi:(p)ppGpp synthase/HD superfamily hydrolase